MIFSDKALSNAVGGDDIRKNVPSIFIFNGDTLILVSNRLSVLYYHTAAVIGLTAAFRRAAGTKGTDTESKSHNDCHSFY